MKNIGVIEGFFGPQWPMQSRLSYAEFLARHEATFYIYAPKQDAYLRKKWREDWSIEYKLHLTGLVHHFHQYGIKFGVGFSPFGLGTVLEVADKKLLCEKVQQMSLVGIDYLGLFFDDMPTNENLAQTQIEALHLVKENFHGKIIFCPSYYSPDPLLDKVFGTRPANYLEDIASGLPLDVSIAWTGPKVISPTIDSLHLDETIGLLKRKPFIWENLYANDGPKNCKFLKLKPFSGRDRLTFERTEAFGFNLMSQPELSKLLFLSSKFVLQGEIPEMAFQKALEELCGQSFKSFLNQHAETFYTKGLDNFDSQEKSELLKKLSLYSDPGAKEISDWLIGIYNVGSECLTD